MALFNREAIGCSKGKNKNADFVRQAFTSVKTILNELKFFHTDRDSM